MSEAIRDKADINIEYADQMSSGRPNLKVFPLFLFHFNNSSILYIFLRIRSIATQGILSDGIHTFPVMRPQPPSTSVPDHFFHFYYIFTKLSSFDSPSRPCPVL